MLRFGILSWGTLDTNTPIDETAYQVVECQAADISWFDAKVLECLRREVNFLINKFPFDLIGRQDWPPQSSVQDCRSRLENGLRDIDMSAMLDNLLIDQFSNLCRGVILGAVELEGLRGSIVILEHFLKGLANVDSLQRLVTKSTPFNHYLHERASNVLACD
jgi:hypothetical protein